MALESWNYLIRMMKLQFYREFTGHEFRPLLVVHHCVLQTK